MALEKNTFKLLNSIKSNGKVNIEFGKEVDFAEG